MADTYLLVPMQLDAMVLNQEASVATPFLRFQMDYSQLQSFNNPEPRPFEGPSHPGAGVYLHWTLPRALRSGIHRDDGSTSFPLVPNRYLVVRLQAGAPAARGAKAWVLESDYVGSKVGSEGTSPFVDPAGLQGGTPTPTRLGRATLLSALQSLEVQSSPFLRAVGPGNVTFSTFSPGVENVFSFYDPVTADDDTTQVDQATFTYWVMGWYSDPAHDPLGTTQWQEKPKSPGTYVNKPLDPKDPDRWPNDWFVHANSADLPRRMLVHALVSAVPWDRRANNPPAKNYPTNVPNTVKVAVGNTAIDALSAIVRLDKNSQTEADLLEAFQYGLLDHFDQPGSSEALNLAIRQHWYGASLGGTLWTIVPKEQKENTSLPTPPPAPITGPQQAALAALNAAQHELDRQDRILESMRWNLLGLWWKWMWQQYNNPPVDGGTSKWLGDQLQLQVGQGSTCNNPAGGDPGKESWYVCKVQAQQNLVGQLTAQANAARSRLQGLLDATQELKAANMPQYHYPRDPVVLITGLGRSTNFDPVGGVMCRLPSQTVSSLTVGGTTYGVDASSGADIRNRIPLLGDPRSLLPEAVAQLNIESVFLSPALFARDILNSPGQEPAVKAALQALPGPSAAARFAPAAYAMGEWQQPWVPLLLDWQVTVLQQPAYSDGQGQPTWTFNQGNWRFDGADFQWAGSTSATDFSESSQMTLTGRTFITPHLAFSLGDKLRKYVQTHRLRDPNLEKLLEDLEGFVEKITGQDILSQSLSGMLAMMVQRTFTQNVVPSGEITRVLGDTYHGYPLPWPNQHASYAPAVFDFAPLCGTFFVINKLTVIDAFGRTIDLMLANYSSYPHRGSDQKDYPQEDYFYPITGRNLKAPTALDPAPGRRKSTDPTQRMIQLTPGPVQDSQLCFRLISNDGQDSDISERAGASPICGWVLPNHLDRSLALYAPDGQAWGELYLSRQVGGTYDPAWQPDPTNPRAPQHVDDIPNEYVRAMMKALWDRKDNGKAFSDFLQVVDETLWTVNPLGDRNDRNLSVLVGRPLAVVRAELSLKLRGLPFYNQDWWNTFDMTKANPSDGTQPAPLGTIDGGMTGSSYYWPVRLGSRALRDDGLIGYFAVPWDRQADHPPAPADTYRVFNTVTLPAGLKTDYLKQIGQDNYLLLRAVDDTVTAPDPDRNQVARLTLLVDPRAGVHAFTGLLPVVKLDVQSQFITPALQTMAYTFRAGPILTARDAIRVPRPAEDKGTWSWFDRVLNAATPLTPADANARISPTASQGKEGWLKFTPNPSEDGR